MTRLFMMIICLLGLTAEAAAQGSVRGRVLDKQNDEALQFVNIRIMQGEKMVKGAVTDMNGAFAIGGLPDGQYTVSLSFVGYKNVNRPFSITPQNRRHTFPAIYMSEDSRTLKEVQVTGQRSQMKLEVDRKTFSVDEVQAG